MQSNKPDDTPLGGFQQVIEDMSRLAGNAMGTVFSMRTEVESQVREQMQRFFSSFDMVSREEFEVVRAMAQEARTQQKALEKKMVTLEAKLAGAKAAPAKKAAPKKQPAAKSRNTKAKTAKK